jgi:uncharacterized membrane protein (UPF0136 family)
MNGNPWLHLFAAGVTTLYGVVSIGGGLVGYLRAGSTISLLAGGGAGVLLLACAFGILRLPSWSLLAAAVIALLLVGRFTASLFKGEQLSDVLQVTALVMINGGVLVIVNAVLALLIGSRPTPNP